MIDNILKIVFCHLLGDYVLQCDFIAKSKGENKYHMFVHCVLYCLPFYLFFGNLLKLLFVFITHFGIDELKARYKKIDYTTDQIFHYLVACIYLI